MRVLLVEDEEKVARFVARGLKAERYAVDVANDGNSGLDHVRAYTYDLIILDLNLPGMSGTELLKHTRKSHPHVPVLILTARDNITDKVKNFEEGADDYLTKPFSPRTLVARVKALLRRAGRQPISHTRAGELSLDQDLLTLRIADRDIKVTPLESRLLQLLLANAGQVVHTDRLLVHVWGHRGGGDRALLKQLVHRLRQKIGDDPEQPRWLSTIPSVGYMLRGTP